MSANFDIYIFGQLVANKECSRMGQGYIVFCVDNARNFIYS